MAKVPPRNPKYTPADLWPPGSQGNVDFPPAAFHPVYLGNFLCQQQDEMVARVQQYFASKGLLARMVFVRNPQNDPFRNYQDKTKLYDCLVYFTRPEDALDAVKYLHRDKYYGHRLNIFPGRTSKIMDLANTVGYVLTDALSRWPETLLEDHIAANSQANIRCIRRPTVRHLFVQYQDENHLRIALAEYRYLGACRIAAGEVIQMQRFVECNVAQEIRLQVKNTAFMEMAPERHVLDALYNGITRNVPTDWTKCVDLAAAFEPAEEPTDKTLCNIAIATKKTFRVECNFNKNRKKRIGKKHLQRQLQRQQTNAKRRVQLPWQAAMEERPEFEGEGNMQL